MELDDLRRHWQQREPAAGAALTPAQLSELLARQRIGLVDKMRRNVRLEAGLTGVVGLAMLVALPYAQGFLFSMYSGMLLGLAVWGLLFYRRLLQVLHRMAEPTGNVREHLGTLVYGIRRLLRFYYRLTVSITPVMTLFLYGFILWKLADRGKLAHWQVTAVTTGLLLLCGTVVQVGVVHGARWYGQWLYGQHLDRLEGQLRELNESPVLGQA